MTNAARSVDIYLKNLLEYTGTLLQKGQADLSHGIWNASLTPPSVVYPSTTEHFAAESNGFATGTQGDIVYEGVAIGSAKLIFDVPYDGSSSFDVDVDGNYIVVSYDNPPTRGKQSLNVDWHISVDRTPVIQLTITNNISDSLISLTDVQLTNGTWRDQPPQTLNPGDSQTCALDPHATGLTTPISGYIQYACRDGFWKISFSATLMFGFALTNGSCSANSYPPSNINPDDASELPGGSLAWTCTVT